MMHRNPHASCGPSTGIGLGFTAIQRNPDSTLRAVNYSAIVMLASGGAGERAGLLVGDTILLVNGRDARLAPIFPNRVSGARYVLRVRRGVEDRELVLVLLNTPPAQPAPPDPPRSR